MDRIVTWTLVCACAYLILRTHDRAVRAERRILMRLSHIESIITDQGASIMAGLTDLQAAVAREDTVIDSAVELIKGLAAQVAALQPDQAAIDALAADINAKADALAEAVTQNTEAQP